MPTTESHKVRFQWGIRIPLRDGIHLHANLYLPKDQVSPLPCLFAMTPYIADHLHERAVYFAARGAPFLAIDVRGRGNSEGRFRPFIQEAQDGHDVVEWLAQQPYCNGKAGMYGGSYLGYAQWATAKEFPPHLTTIVPTASPFAGVDFPVRKNIALAYEVRWLNVVAGRASQMKTFLDEAFWAKMYRELYESGRPFRQADTACGSPSATFQEYLVHPELGPHWDQYNPTAQEYARLDMPILTITGAYDGDQPGALEHYNQHMRNASVQARARHYLIIGPWEHGGTAMPAAEFGGLKVGPASLIDMGKLHSEWYSWTMQSGPKPEFLKKNVAFYVIGAERWRYADTLDAVTARSEALYLQSDRNPTDVFQSGFLTPEPLLEGGPDHYVYDPADISLAELESTLEEATAFVDQRLIHASRGKQLIYHSAPFEQNVEVTGFFRLRAWISIDQPDTDFRAWVYEIDAEGRSVLLTMDSIRARYRQSRLKAALIRSSEPLPYDFCDFAFVSRLIKKGHRLRLVFGPINSIYEQKNYNTGGVVSDETMEDARPVRVNLLHDPAHPSALYVPLGHPVSADEPSAPPSAWLSQTNLRND